MQERLKRDGQPDIAYQWDRNPQPRQDRAILLIQHGYLERSASYDHLIDNILDQGFDIFRFDLRGHGFSDGRRAYVEQFEDYTDDLAALVELIAKENPEQPIIIYGHSLGGLIALDYCASENCSAQVKGLLQSSPYLELKSPILGFLKTLGKVLDKTIPRFRLRAPIAIALMTHDEERRAQIKSDPMRGRETTPRWFAECCKLQAQIPKLYLKLRVPAFCYFAGADLLADSHATKAYLLAAKEAGADVTFAEAEGAYHELHNELNREEYLATFLTHADAMLKRSAAEN